MPNEYSSASKKRVLHKPRHSIHFIMVQNPPGTDPFTIPFMPRPDGGLSDFTKRSELLTTTIVVCSLMLSLQVVFVGLRVFVRSGSDHQWRTDDCGSLGFSISLLFITHTRVFGCHLSLYHHSWWYPDRGLSEDWSPCLGCHIGILSKCLVATSK
jgi:hypothetical protein